MVVITLLLLMVLDYSYVIYCFQYNSNKYYLNRHPIININIKKEGFKIINNHDKFLFKSLNHIHLSMSSSYRDDASSQQESNVNVSIEAPTFNSRKITANIIINSSMDNVWSILTDYNNLATHVPNLVQSYLIPVPEDKQKLRLFQEGAQKIIGFDFRASLIMDMLPVPYDDNLG